MLSPAWNEIASSVKLLSHCKRFIGRLAAASQTRHDDEKRICPKQWLFFPKWNTNIRLRSQFWLCTHAIPILLYMFHWSMQASKKNLCIAKKHPFTCCAAANHQNAANLALQTCEKYQWTFLWHCTDGDFSFRNNVSNLCSFAKVSVPVESIIPWLLSVIY